MKALIIRTEAAPSKAVEARDIKADLDTYYDIIGCRCIDIVSYPIGGKRYDIICDDEGLFNPEPTVTAIDKNGRPLLVGNLIICLHDRHGNEKGLEPADVDRLLQKIYCSVQNDEMHPVIMTDL